MKRKAVILLAVLVMCFMSVGAGASVLYKGMSKEAVLALQMNLNGLSYSTGQVDGIYGARTYDAVKRFQTENGLTPDGIAGDNTNKRIKSIVTEVQTALKGFGYLNSGADGIYGTATREAVKKFQSDNYITADGIAGKNTLAKIRNHIAVGAASGFARTASNVVTYSVKKDGKKMLTKNFSVAEFKCNDGSDSVMIDKKLAALLQEIRNHFGKPVIINSAYRTAQYNRKAGGSSKSLHLYGKAADIKIDGVSPYSIAKYCQSLGVKGIGLYNTFVHVDTRENKYYWRTSGSSTWQVSGF